MNIIEHRSITSSRFSWKGTLPITSGERFRKPSRKPASRMRNISSLICHRSALWTVPHWGS